MEPRRDVGIVRFRIDGVLHQVYQIPTAVMAAMTSRIKILGRMDVVEKRRPQDGRIKTRTADGQEIELRLSTLPTAFGEKLVMRVFDPEVLVKDFAELGFSEDDKARWKQMTAAPQRHHPGDRAHRLGQDDHAVLDAEDACHGGGERLHHRGSDRNDRAGVQPDAGDARASTSASPTGVRALMRQDPDIIMVGEIRDLETAEMACRPRSPATWCSRPCTPTTPPRPSRGCSIWACRPTCSTSTILGVMAQRLVRTLCPHCKQKVPLRRSLRADDLTWEEFVAPWKSKRPEHVYRPGGLPGMPQHRLPRPHRHLRNPAAVARDQAPGRRQRPTSRRSASWPTRKA